MFLPKLNLFVFFRIVVCLLIFDESLSVISNWEDIRLKTIAFNTYSIIIAFCVIQFINFVILLAIVDGVEFLFNKLVNLVLNPWVMTPGSRASWVTTPRVTQG